MCQCLLVPLSDIVPTKETTSTHSFRVRYSAVFVVVVVVVVVIVVLLALSSLSFLSFGEDDNDDAAVAALVALAMRNRTYDKDPTAVTIQAAVVDGNGGVVSLLVLQFVFATTCCNKAGTKSVPGPNRTACACIIIGGLLLLLPLPIAVVEDETDCGGVVVGADIGTSIRSTSSKRKRVWLCG